MCSPAQGDGLPVSRVPRRASRAMPRRAAPCHNAAATRTHPSNTPGCPRVSRRRTRGPRCRAGRRAQACPGSPWRQAQQPPRQRQRAVRQRACSAAEMSAAERQQRPQRAPTACQQAPAPEETGPVVRRRRDRPHRCALPRRERPRLAAGWLACGTRNARVRPGLWQGPRAAWRQKGQRHTTLAEAQSAARSGSCARVSRPREGRAVPVRAATPCRERALRVRLLG